MRRVDRLRCARNTRFSAGLGVNQIAVRFDGAGTGEEYWITSYPKNSYNNCLRQFLDEKTYKPTFEPFKTGTMIEKK